MNKRINKEGINVGDKVFGEKEITEAIYYANEANIVAMFNEKTGMNKKINLNNQGNYMLQILNIVSSEFDYFRNIVSEINLDEEQFLRVRDYFEKKFKKQCLKLI